MAEEVNLEQLQLFHPKLRPYVKVLLTHEFGLLRDLPKISNIQCGSIIRKNQFPCCDRFQLRILYCRKPLNWHVLMNGNDVTKAPDFIMDENFLADASPEMIKLEVPSLVNWNPSDVRCLLNVILELLQLYKNYQLSLLKVESLHRYLFEYETLVTMAGISPDSVEVCVQNTIRTVTVIFLIHLNVDFSMLPTALPNCKDLIVLVVEFKDNTKSTIQLMPRIELEDVFGGPLDLPDLVSEMSLLDYVPELELLLQKKVKKIINSMHQRKMLYSYLVQFFEPSLINGDNINFKNVSFLLELDGFFCVLNINIPLDYPESCPVLQLLTLLNTSGNQPYVVKGFNFNPSMTHEKVARSIFSYVRDIAIADFQKNL